MKAGLEGRRSAVSVHRRHESFEAILCRIGVRSGEGGVTTLLKELRDRERPSSRLERGVTSSPSPPAPP